MAGENESASQEAEARKTIDALKATIAEKDTKIAELTTTVTDLYRVDKARVALKGKVADPDEVASILGPQLRDTEPDKVAEVINSDEFQPRLAAFRPAETPTAANGDEGGEGAEAPAATEPGAGGFGGPSPGNDGASQTVTGGTEKVRVGSPEYLQLISDPAQYQQAQKDGRIAEPAPIPLRG